MSKVSVLVTLFPLPKPSFTVDPAIAESSLSSKASSKPSLSRSLPEATLSVSPFSTISKTPSLSESSSK